MTIILLFFSNARARHRSCLSPILKLIPPSLTSSLSFHDNFCTMAVRLVASHADEPLRTSAWEVIRLASSSASHNSLSPYSSKGSKFMRSEQVNRVGSWVITEIARRDLWRQMLLFPKLYFPSLGPFAWGLVSRIQLNLGVRHNASTDVINLSTSQLWMTPNCDVSTTSWSVYNNDKAVTPDEERTKKHLIQNNCKHLLYKPSCLPETVIAGLQAIFFLFLFV